MLRPETREVVIDGQVCIEQGILEYLAVAAKGKEYESLVSLRCRPSHLQAALLVAGYQAGELPPELRGDFSPQADPAGSLPPQGAPQIRRPPADYWETAAATAPTRVTLEVEVSPSDGPGRRVPIEALLADRSTGRSPPRLTWAFTGSFFHRDPSTGLEYFAADAEKSLIALWYDPTALLNLTRDVGNPYRGETGLEFNANAAPKKGAPVRLILRPLSSTAE